jgi:UDP-glucuronate 4-epimerase
MTARKRTKKQAVLVTGSAGFIGFHLAQKLLKAGFTVVGLDNLNDYYDPKLKEARNALLKKNKDYVFYKLDLVEKTKLVDLFDKYRFDYVVHLAAQAGVRYSLTNPDAYQASNLEGMLNILECARAYPPKHLLFASSSSVYGNNRPGKNGYSETDRVDNPISLYAATKKSDELMAHTYCHLFGLNISGFRFFTVYGPWGRPDMAYFSFSEALFDGQPIRIFNHGKMWRDFTYIDDITSGLLKAIKKPAGYQIYNLGNNQPVLLSRFVETLEKFGKRKFVKKYESLQPGDVLKTHANIDKAKEVLGYDPKTPIEAGLKKFMLWYKQYHKN